ncbi:MAG: hypothetical protein RW306_07465 [Geobacteraceae bacterium]|nr:hypothetical protein [Geobacteraceae bacterium]
MSVLNKKIEIEITERKEGRVLLIAKISALSKRFDGVDSRLDGIEIRLDDMISELTAHRNRTEQHKVSRKREVRKVA